MARPMPRLPPVTIAVLPENIGKGFYRGVPLSEKLILAVRMSGTGGLATASAGGEGGGGDVQGRQKLKFSRPGSTVQQIQEIQRFASLAPRRIAVFRPSANGRASSGRTVHRSLPSTARNGRAIR